MDAPAKPRRRGRRSRAPNRQRKASDDEDQNETTQRDNDDLAPGRAVPALPDATPSPSVDTPHLSTTASASLITQFPRAGAQLEERATVVTVTQTQTNDSDNTGGTGSPNTSGSSVPIGIIAGSVAVGIVLACSVVGLWIWWGKKLKREAKAARQQHLAPRPNHKNQASSESTARLNGAASSPREKPRSHSHSHSSTPRASGDSRGSSRSRPGESGARRPGQSSSAPVPTPSTSRATADKRLSPPGLSTASPTSQDNSTLSSPSSAAEEVPRPGLKTYTPAKPSPLAAGAERAKPKERSKINEWAKPTSPPGSLNGHGNQLAAGPSSSGYESGSHTRTPYSENQHLIIPGSGAQDPRRDRISVLSSESYYAPEDEDPYVGVALGGDDPSPSTEGYPPQQHYDPTAYPHYGQPPAYGSDNYSNQYPQQGGWR